MANRPQQLKSAFTKDDVRVLYRLLCQRTLVSRWEVGAVLVKGFDGRAGYGGLDQLSEMLKSRGADAPASPNQLQKCRTLSQVWQRRDAKAADQVKLPWGHAIKLIFVEVLAAKRSDRSKARRIIKKCRKLATSYPPSRNEERTRWIEAIRELQQRVQTGHSDLPASRLLGKEKLSLMMQLQVIERTLNKMMNLYSDNRDRDRCSRLLKKFTALTAGAEALAPKKKKTVGK